MTQPAVRSPAGAPPAPRPPAAPVPGGPPATAVSPAQLGERLLRARKIAGRYPPGVWLACLPKVGRLDAGNDRKRGALGVSAWLFPIGSVIALAVLAAPAVAWLVATAVETALIIGWYRLHAADLANYLPGFVVPLCEVLREEMAPDALLGLRIDLSGRTAKEKRQPSLARGGPERFVDPWLSGEASLQDDSLLTFRVVDHTDRRRISKRSRSGKTKTKTVDRVRRLIEVVLKVKNKDYAPEAAPAQGKVAVKGGERRTAVRVRRVAKLKVIGGLSGPEPDLDLLLQAIGEAYQRVTPKREERHP